MTRNDLEQAVYRLTGKATASPNSDTQTRIRHFINRRYRRLLADAGTSSVFDDTTQFASVANQSRYALPNIERITRLRETTNDRTLFPMSMADYRAVAPDPTSSASTPSHWVFSGFEPVAKQPSDASEIFVKSSAAGDTMTAYLELDITGDYPRSLSVSLTGATAVSFSASVTSGLRIKKFYLASAPVGVVTLHEDSGAGTELARIGIGQTSQRYYVFYLHPQPTAVVTYDADVQIPVTDLAQNTDEPRLPEKFHDLLYLGAAMDEMGKTDDTRYLQYAREYKELHDDWILWLALQRPSRMQPYEKPSQLGSWFPAGS